MSDYTSPRRPGDTGIPPYRFVPGTPVIGRRVLNRWQGNNRGVIVAVEPGCNTLVRVRFDGRDFDVALPASDLAFEDVYPGEGSNVCLAL